MPRPVSSDDPDDGPESVNADAWQAYAAHRLRRGTVLAEAERSVEADGWSGVAQAPGQQAWTSNSRGVRAVGSR
jgi:hypothetical protein